MLFSGNRNIPFDKKTYINFTPETPINLKDKFTLSCDVSIPEPTTYGKIFRAEDKMGITIGLAYAYHLDPEYSYLILVVNNQETAVRIPLPRHELIRNNWFNIGLCFDLTNNQVTAWKDGKFIAQAAVRLPKELNLSFSSGRTVQDLDSPRMALANFAIRDKSNRLVHIWKLEEVSGNKAFDSEGGRFAQVDNGEWLALRHSKWVKTAEFTFPQMDSYGITFDTQQQRILFFDNDYFIDFNITGENFQKKYYNNKRPFIANNPVYNSYNNKIYSYYRGQGQVTLFDEGKLKWTNADSCKYAGEHYYAHTPFINPLNGDLLMFGGYGWFKFQNELRKYNFNSRKWEVLKLKGDFIQPRFRTAVTPYKNKGEFLLIGGSGTNTGTQEEGEKYFYDIYVLNMKDTSLKRIGEIKQGELGFSFMNYADFDNDHSVYFPGFCRAGNVSRLYFYKLDLNTFALTVSDSIVSDKFNADAPYCFLKSKTNEFYLIYSIKNKDKDSSVCVVYKKAYKPVEYSVLASIQDENLRHLYGRKLKYFLLTGITVVIAAALGFFVKKKRNNGSAKINRIFKRPGNMVAMKPENPNLDPECLINLFGNFNILDKTGKEITHELSPKLKEILLAIILNMKVQGDVRTGISSEKLTLLLWPDSNPVRAKNNRNSSIAKIRAFLHKTGCMDLEFSEMGWLFNCNKLSACDYLYYLNLKNELLKKTGPAEDLLAAYIQIVGRGNLLSDISYEWLDPVKISVESEVISTCFKFISQNNLSTAAITGLNLMNVILRWDPLNENALQIKIRRLLELGRYGEAKSAYELFTLEYRKVFDKEYSISFKDLSG